MMESPPTSLPKPFRPASLHPQELATDEADSGVGSSCPTPRCCCCSSRGPTSPRSSVPIEEDGFTVVPISDASSAEASGYVPRLAILDGSAPGALDSSAPHQRARMTLHAIVTIPRGVHREPGARGRRSAHPAAPAEASRRRDVLAALPARSTST